MNNQLIIIPIVHIFRTFFAIFDNFAENMWKLVKTALEVLSLKNSRVLFNWLIHFLGKSFAKFFQNSTFSHQKWHKLCFAENILKLVLTALEVLSLKTAECCLTDWSIFWVKVLLNFSKIQPFLIKNGTNYASLVHCRYIYRSVIP